MDDNQKNTFQSTLNLPKTDFSIRANAAIKEPETLKRWDAEDLSGNATAKNQGKQKFILHDGPPYANGHLHLGHALTYILKDAVCKAKRMAGYHAPLIPGWDCHGLPIELKVTTEKGIEKNPSAVERVTFKKYCREFAQQWIEIQKAELKEFGKLADYEHPYITMKPEYESKILEALAAFVQAGNIERKLKTVPWCASCKTVLATAEIEYKDRTDPSLYVLFKIPDERARLLFPMLFEAKPHLVISMAVWTTTPWTLPLNRAVVLNPTIEYAVIQGADEKSAFVVAKELAERVCKEVGIPCVELATCDARIFEGARVGHPCIDDFTVPIILDTMVQSSEGTACLHSAPGCGPEDYVLGVRHNLEIFSPLSADGKYTKGIVPELLEGVAITDGQKMVLDLLKAKGSLLAQKSISHSYPHCWRCHKGLMFRATKQWFCDLTKNDLVSKALSEIEKIVFVPERARARLHSFVSNRTEWCISRQRQWGVPIPALLCNDCGWAFLDAPFIKKVAASVKQEGIEFWDRATVQDFVRLGFIESSFACPGCKNKDANKFSLERDILDVWFDSGISSYAVLAEDPKNLGVPADMYFEGADQHRGWFQSSLLCGVVLYGHSPTKSIVTHGFILDEQKRKMSKSLNNVVAPTDVIKKYSRDVLRLWVACVDFEDDFVISDKLLANVAEMYRKIRNTCRFLIANLYDFDVTKDAVCTQDLWAIDQYALATLHDINTKVREAYDQYRFASVVHTLNAYCTNDLSAVYLDIVKDRLYVEKADGLARRSAQTVMYQILDTITKLFAPVLSFLAEEVSDFYQKNKTQSIHLQDFASVPDLWAMVSQKEKIEYLPLHMITADSKETVYMVQKQAQWIMLEMLRDAVLKAIEVQRNNNVVKHSYEAAVTFYIDTASKEHQLLMQFIAELKSCEQDVERFFKDWFVVSRVTIALAATDLESTALEWLKVSATAAEGVKCPRCWRWSVSAHEAGLCPRCEQVLKD